MHCIASHNYWKRIRAFVFWDLFTYINSFRNTKAPMLNGWKPLLKAFLTTLCQPPNNPTVQGKLSYKQLTSQTLLSTMSEIFSKLFFVTICSLIFGYYAFQGAYSCFKPFEKLWLFFMYKYTNTICSNTHIHFEIRHKYSLNLGEKMEKNWNYLKKVPAKEGAMNSEIN